MAPATNRGSTTSGFSSPGTVPTLSWPFNNYLLNTNDEQKGISLISQPFVQTFQVWSMGHKDQSHLGSRLNCRFLGPLQTYSIWVGAPGRCIFKSFWAILLSKH